MKQTISVFAVLLLIPFALAQSMPLDVGADPGQVLPDSPLYGLDKAIDNIQIALTFDPEKKIEKRLVVASERLAEVKAMIELNKTGDAQKAETDRQEKLDDAQKDAEQAGISEETKAKVLENLQKHIIVLQGVQTKLQEKGINQTMGISNAIQSSSKVIERFQNMSVKKEVPKTGY